MSVESFEIVPGLRVGGEHLTLFAGPCMAESEELCLQVAEFLVRLCKRLKINYVFKASFDKANRSSVESYRGPGLEEGLAMLEKVKETFHIPVMTDVHETIQVEAAARCADVLQIPAFLCRQTDLLVAAGKSGRTVNIKKGQFMSPEEMRGALEKVRSTGNHNVILTERGATFGYHNLVVDMRALAVMRQWGAPVFFDATHSVQLPGGQGKTSGGQREFIAPLTRAALAVGIDGIFAEVHVAPEKALSDGANSLDFAMAEKLFTEWKKMYDFIYTSFEN